MTGVHSEQLDSMLDAILQSQGAKNG